MFTLIFGMIIGLMISDYVNLRLNTLFGQRVKKSAEDLKCTALDKYKIFYEDVRMKRSKAHK
jgi:hypothetical protein